MFLKTINLGKVCYEIESQDYMTPDTMHWIAIFCHVKYWNRILYLRIMRVSMADRRILHFSWFCFFPPNPLQQKVHLVYANWFFRSEVVFPPEILLSSCSGPGVKAKPSNKPFGITEPRAICLAVGYSPWTWQVTHFWPVDDNLIAHHYPINMLIITPEVGLKQ